MNRNNMKDIVEAAVILISGCALFVWNYFMLRKAENDIRQTANRRYGRAASGVRLYLIYYDSATCTVYIEENRIQHTVILAKPAMCSCDEFADYGRRGPCSHMIFACTKFLKLKVDDCVEVWKQAEGADTEVVLARVAQKFAEQDKKRADIVASSDPRRPRRYADENCTICLDTMGREEEFWKCIQCEHQLHKNCWYVWANNNPACPMCRHEYPPTRYIPKASAPEADN